MSSIPDQDKMRVRLCLGGPKETDTIYICAKKEQHNSLCPYSASQVDVCLLPDFLRLELHRLSPK